MKELKEKMTSLQFTQYSSTKGWEIGFMGINGCFDTFETKGSFKDMRKALFENYGIEIPNQKEIKFYNVGGVKLGRIKY